MAFVASLFVIQGNDQGRRFELRSATTTIGRDVSSPICLHDHEVSRKHAELRPADGNAYRLVDLGSANGTFVNNLPISAVLLNTGDRVQVGQTVLLFSPGPGAERDLTERVDLLARANPQDRSAIIRSIPHRAGPSSLASADENAQWLNARLAHLSVLYQITQAISHILDLKELLPQILRLVFDTIGADRAAILLGSPAQALVPRAVQWKSTAEPDERLTISQTIVDHVRESGEAVVTTDAPSDDRFIPSQSIVEYSIREAICVPIRGRHTTLGVIYADALGNVATMAAPSPSSRSRFSQEDLTLMMAIGHQAGLAIENTEFHQAKLQSERMAAIGQTMTILSHDIKNILQGLRGGGFLIERGLSQQDEDTVRKGWTIVEKNQNRIYGMVLDMLSLSKEREPGLQPDDLNQTIADVVELVRSRADELNINLHWQADPSLPRLLIDSEALHRAILNLVGNAIDACEGVESARVVVASTWDAAARTAHIIVNDNGAGIAPEEMPTLFQVFASSKGSRGTGLGLAAAEKIVREHGGSINVQSEQGAGTRFDITLPQRDSNDALATLSD